MSSNRFPAANLPWLLGLLGACVGNSAQPPPPPAAPPAVSAPELPVITTVQAGLGPEHLGQVPLLDRVELQAHGRVQATRTYPDGTQYLIASDPNAPPGTAAPAWTRFVRITPVGVARLQDILRGSVLTWTGEAPAAGPSTGGGRITWVVHLDGQERVVQTASGSYDRLPGFVRALDEAVSGNVVVGGG